PVRFSSERESGPVADRFKSLLATDAWPCLYWGHGQSCYGVLRVPGRVCGHGSRDYWSAVSGQGFRRIVLRLDEPDWRCPHRSGTWLCHWRRAGGPVSAGRLPGRSIAPGGGCHVVYPEFYPTALRRYRDAPPSGPRDSVVMAKIGSGVGKRAGLFFALL